MSPALVTLRIGETRKQVRPGGPRAGQWAVSVTCVDAVRWERLLAGKRACRFLEFSNMPCMALFVGGSWRPPRTLSGFHLHLHPVRTQGRV